MRPDMAVLELGCGTGSTALEHAPHVAHIDATDISPAMLGIGREKAERAGITNVSFKQSSVEAIDTPDGGYDMVLGLNLLHLLPNGPRGGAREYQPTAKNRRYFHLKYRLSRRPPVVFTTRHCRHAMIGTAPHISFVGAEQVLQEGAKAGLAEQDHWTHGRANSLFLIARKPVSPS